jgi:deoxyadenosine/deoxycytidine kinase
MYGPIVWVEGPIAAGKTTLSKQIAEALNLRPLFEPVESNPYLELFYKDPKSCAFAMQIHLLHCRYAMQQIAAFEATMNGGYSGAVLDRGMPGDRVFARLHREAGNITELEWQTYERAYNTMVCTLIPPSVIVYLDVEPEVALERVKNRKRGAESGMSLDYLRDLRKGYMDLLVEIESKNHSWSRGMEIMRVPWNVDHQSPDKIINELKYKLRL